RGVAQGRAPRGVGGGVGAVSLPAGRSRFIVETRIEEVPAEVLRLAKRSILDGLGLAVAGSRSTAAEIARHEIESYGGMREDASVLGTEDRTPARFAAFLNGLAIHADDFDDQPRAVLPHRVSGPLTPPTARVLPVALAIGEREAHSGRDVLLAYLLGVEVETKVSEAIDPRHYDTGFHSTATAGTIGAGAAASRLLGLDADHTAVAL